MTVGVLGYKHTQHARLKLWLAKLSLHFLLKTTQVFILSKYIHYFK